MKLKLPEMKTGLAISAVVHLVLLAWGLISFAAKPLEAKPSDALPIDIISDKQFSELTKGVKNAPKTAKPGPLVEKIDTPKPVDDSSAKVTPKKELDATRKDSQQPPEPEKPKPPEAKPAEAKAAEAKPDKKPPEQKPDPIAETLKKEEAKKKAEEAKKKVADERAVKAKAEKDKKQAEAYDPTKIAALLDRHATEKGRKDARELVALIDFGDVTAGDPAYDLAVAWLAFDAAGRSVFQVASPHVDAATWTRARAWAAAVALILLQQSDDNPDYLALGIETADEVAKSAAE